ncbi:LOW QUALITY PROTEIN: leucine-rich repeat-containing protein 27 [Suricata suricatta]|uniref:LOW QUALITY PROTEIN: leucine-rich repeat-containing protein 27 n=1 Tax=Suricata suricatta TaxID=37032 RepID=UPI001155FEF8|nr:LOW QUALITY PROTEIN: leucine-rich repeat-containing protein 27 [Suricata suricatta]
MSGGPRTAPPRGWPMDKPPPGAADSGDTPAAPLREAPQGADGVLLSSSTILDLSQSGLHHLEEISNVPNLKQLHLQRNALRELPPDFFQLLPNLTWLDFRYNRIKALPSGIGSHKHLRTLLLERNPIKTLPVELGNVTTLGGLNLRHCPLEFPARPVVQKGLGAIPAFLQAWATPRPPRRGPASPGAWAHPCTEPLPQPCRPALVGRKKHPGPDVQGPVGGDGGGPGHEAGAPSSEPSALSAAHLRLRVTKGGGNRKVRLICPNRRAEGGRRSGGRSRSVVGPSALGGRVEVLPASSTVAASDLTAPRGAPSGAPPPHDAMDPQEGKGRLKEKADFFPPVEKLGLSELARAPTPPEDWPGQEEVRRFWRLRQETAGKERPEALPHRLLQGELPAGLQAALSAEDRGPRSPRHGRSVCGLPGSVRRGVCDPRRKPSSLRSVLPALPLPRAGLPAKRAEGSRALALTAQHSRLVAPLLSERRPSHGGFGGSGAPCLSPCGLTGGLPPLPARLCLGARRALRVLSHPSPPASLRTILQEREDFTLRPLALHTAPQQSSCPVHAQVQGAGTPSQPLPTVPSGNYDVHATLQEESCPVLCGL